MPGREGGKFFDTEGTEFTEGGRGREDFCCGGYKIKKFWKYCSVLGALCGLCVVSGLDSLEEDVLW